ncbi:MAG: hypothetical protein RSE12_03310 [Fuscovulum sp.]|jgi:hypothetical protein|nr:hypothetical protein [Paracoccaceae bacterium]MCZ8082115.1 hypothetical protein [Paracoccaceae bacterium]WRH63379.1 MAG: hypothetical protein RSE12_03310 [Fuscovulum sp.]
MLRAFLSLLALLTLAACGAEPVWAPEERVQAARYVHDGPPSITLFTVINNRSNAGAHSGLMINGTERIMFDPAGTWQHPRIPERNDVHYGITPRIVNFYIDYHARETFRVVEQTVIVSPGVAALVAQRAKAYGAVPKAQCAKSVTEILRGVPGFENVRSSWYPNKIMDDFAKIPGVTTRVIRDEDADKNHGVLLVQAGEAPI